MFLFIQPIPPIATQGYFLGNVKFPQKTNKQTNNKNQLLQHHEMLGESPQEAKLLKMLQSEPSTLG